MTKSIRQRVFEQLDPTSWPRMAMSPTNKFLVVLILTATLVAILETEPWMEARYARWFIVAEMCFGLLFAVEYLARLWTAVEEPGEASTARKRLRFIFSPSGIIDLVVVLATFAPFVTANVAVIRLLRLVRMIRLAKLGRLSGALRTLHTAVYSRRFELGVTLCLGAMLLVLGASALYWVEGEVQPDKFGSIPRSLWWAVITMTTIGYGDVYPVTSAGKFLASLVAIGGIGLIAMPTGILAAAFSDAMQEHRRAGADNGEEDQSCS